ncbi:2Fe-2S iron-sulfur cluster-binding protein [Nocardia sp. R7R-8]|uniref:2Fe-2S iron-sulfur cluster-binding protein n=1 Tax=Nocardia sp. R7R-8 TaxID=3459304 RepID=UPI00403DE3EC
MTAARRSLLVTSVASEAAGVVSIELRHPEGAELPAWEPGAHIDLYLPSGLVRQYSLCSDPADRTRYRIAVLRVADGRGGSIEVHDTGLAGRELEVVGPRNHFPLAAAPNYLLIAGGIGVTPLLTIACRLARQGQRWSMIYGGRSRTSMAFIDELTALGGLVDIVPQDERGLPDLATAVRACPPGTAVYCCGPEAMLRVVQSLCATHLPAGALHIERFAAAAPDSAGRACANQDFEVELARSGRVLTVPADRTVLDAVLDAQPGTPYSCTEGYCGTCEVTVLGGTPDHRDDVLTDAERESGKTMMICVSRARSRRLILDL